MTPPSSSRSLFLEGGGPVRTRPARDASLYNARPLLELCDTEHYPIQFELLCKFGIRLSQNHSSKWTADISLVVNSCLLIWEYQSSTINPPILFPSMQNNHPSSFSWHFAKPTNGNTTHHRIILPHFLNTVSCTGPCFIQVNNRSPFHSVFF